MPETKKLNLNPLYKKIYYPSQLQRTEVEKVSQFVWSLTLHTIFPFSDLLLYHLWNQHHSKKSIPLCHKMTYKSLTTFSSSKSIEGGRVWRVRKIPSKGFPRNILHLTGLHHGTCLSLHQYFETWYFPE